MYKAIFGILIAFTILILLNACAQSSTDESELTLKDIEESIVKDQQQLNEFHQSRQSKCGGLRCPREKYELDEEICKCRFVNGTAYSHGCNLNEISPSRMIEGVNRIRWASDSTMVVYVIAMVNCARSVTDTNYRVNGNELVLQYEVSKGSPDKPLVACACPYELVYRIYDLDKRDYDIRVKQAY